MFATFQACRRRSFYFCLDMPFCTKCQFQYCFDFFCQDFANICQYVSNVCQYSSMYGIAYVPTVFFPEGIPTLLWVCFVAEIRLVSNQCLHLMYRSNCEGCLKSNGQVKSTRCMRKLRDADLF